MSKPPGDLQKKLQNKRKPKQYPVVDSLTKFYCRICYNWRYRDQWTMSRHWCDDCHCLGNDRLILLPAVKS